MLGLRPFRHGRETFYSHRLTDTELQERLLASLTYSKKFDDERRMDGRVTVGWFSADERKALRRALEVCRRNRQKAGEKRG